MARQFNVSLTEGTDFSREEGIVRKKDCTPPFERGTKNEFYALVIQKSSSLYTNFIV
jgi:hypothetical protein